MLSATEELRKPPSSTAREAEQKQGDRRDSQPFLPAVAVSQRCRVSGLTSDALDEGLGHDGVRCDRFHQPRRSTWLLEKLHPGSEECPFLGAKNLIQTGMREIVVS